MVGDFEKGRHRVQKIKVKGERFDEKRGKHCGKVGEKTRVGGGDLENHVREGAAWEQIGEEQKKIGEGKKPRPQRREGGIQ